MSGNSNSKSSGQMGKDDSARISSANAKSGGDMTSGGFAARAQGAADRNANASGNTSSGGQAGNAQGGSNKK